MIMMMMMMMMMCLIGAVVSCIIRCIFTNVHDITLTQQEAELSPRKSSIFSLARGKASKDDGSLAEPSMSRFKKLSEMMMTSGGAARRSSISQQSVLDGRAVEGEWSHQVFNIAIGVQCRLGERIALKTQVKWGEGCFFFSCNRFYALQQTYNLCC